MNISDYRLDHVLFVSTNPHVHNQRPLLPPSISFSVRLLRPGLAGLSGKAIYVSSPLLFVAWLLMGLPWGLK